MKNEKEVLKENILKALNRKRTGCNILSSNVSVNVMDLVTSYYVNQRNKFINMKNLILLLLIFTVSSIHSQIIPNHIQNNQLMQYDYCDLTGKEITFYFEYEEDGQGVLLWYNTGKIIDRDVYNEHYVEFDSVMDVAFEEYWNYLELKYSPVKERNMEKANLKEYELATMQYLHKKILLELVSDVQPFKEDIVELERLAIRYKKWDILMDDRIPFFDGVINATIDSVFIDTSRFIINENYDDHE